MSTLRVHGGPDALGLARHDFSSNGNACGPCPEALGAVRDADPMHYPDPAYTALREKLAAFHEVPVWRVLIAGSGSEFIQRITALVDRRGGTRVWIPHEAYSEYALAARARGMVPIADLSQADLVWLCEPSSPRGAPEHSRPVGDVCDVVLDRAYEPLRLRGTSSWSAAELDQVWQLWSPNKALGLTGIRAAYAIAPVHATNQTQALEQLAPSWVIGAHGVALLQSWCQPETQQWLHESLETLRTWAVQWADRCHRMQWQWTQGDANFGVAHAGLDPETLSRALQALRSEGIKLRLTDSLGLPGHIRVALMPPGSQQALENAWQQWIRNSATAAEVLA